MSLWVDKYRPTKLANLDYHCDQAVQLAELVRRGDFPHLMFYGPSGAGKKTRIMCLLRELYGPGVERLRLEHQTFLTPSKKKVEVTTVASNYHIEVNASDAGIYDRCVIQELIKNTASVSQFDSSQQRDFKVVVLTEVDRLTRDAQHALRRTMEKYTATCRLILYCTSTSKVTPAIRSRCLGLRVPAPSAQEVSAVLHKVCAKEGLNLPEPLAERIVRLSRRNLRRALLMTEACRVAQYPFSADQEVAQPDWQVFLRDTAAMVVQQQSPARLLEVRGRLYDLLSHCIPYDVIVAGLVAELVGSCDNALKVRVVNLAAHYEHRMQRGQKAIFHLEAFLAQFMALYKKFIEESAGGMEEW